MSPSGVLLEQVLPPHASSAANARALVREALETASVEEWADPAQLAVSEVVTNSLVHAGTAVRLHVRVDESGLRVEVADGSPHLPLRRDHSVASGTGRGLHLVTGLVDEWGSFAHDHGKVVWFEIRPTPEVTTATEPLGEVSAGESAVGAATVEVVLRDFPLLIHLAWQEHAAALLREFLLAGLEEDDVATFERHARASDAMNLLFEQVPAPPLGDDPEAIMAMATEPGVTADRLVLTIPRDSVSNFETLGSMLDDAAALAAAGGLLVPPTQPEVREMRVWLCRQVLDQGAEGGAGHEEPEPWCLPDTWIREEFAVPPGWDQGEYERARHAVLVTNERNLIVAVSPSAARLLGYSDPDDLVGRRITRIVPPRYHQAHIAGTTLHMVNGRAPLLGRRVRLPAVRADGSEVMVSAVVEARPLPDGHRIFVADFDEGAQEAS